MEISVYTPRLLRSRISRHSLRIDVGILSYFRRLTINLSDILGGFFGNVNLADGTARPGGSGTRAAAEQQQQPPLVQQPKQCTDIHAITEQFQGIDKRGLRPS